MAALRRYSGTGTKGASGGGENLVLVVEDMVGEEEATFQVPRLSEEAECKRLL